MNKQYEQLSNVSKLCPRIQRNKTNLVSLRPKVGCGSEIFDKLGSQLTRMRKYVERQNTGLFSFNQYL